MLYSFHPVILLAWWKIFSWQCRASKVAKWLSFSIKVGQAFWSFNASLCCLTFPSSFKIFSVLETWYFKRYLIFKRRSRPFVRLWPFSLWNNLVCRRCTNWANYHIYESRLTKMWRHCVSAMANRKVDFIIQRVSNAFYMK